MVAGGKSKKTKRTAPKSNDIYLKLLVKVSLSLSLARSCERSLICEFGFVVVPVSGEEDRQPIQCGDIEAFDHEQSQQSAALPLPTHTAREGQGSLLF